MPKDTGSEIDGFAEILGAYGIVRKGKKPPFGLVNIESDTLFEHLEALIDKRVRDELQEALSLWTAGETKQYMLDRVKALSDKHSSKEDVDG